MSSSHPSRASGVTIVELIIFMVIMGVAAAGVIGLLNLGATSSADPLRRKQAMMIAEALMEEVQQARFTFCAANDPAADTATQQNNCTVAPMVVGARVAGATRPYGNVADYANVAGAAERTFAVIGIDTDINGLALGANAAGVSTLGAITSTVTLNYLNTAARALGPANLAILSTAANVNALQITIITRYGTAPNDVVQLDGYRTRYAPEVLP
ncbi:MAG: type II secretion system protein [Duganella sp.]